MWILVLVNLAKRISVSDVVYMLSSKILAMWSMILQLSRYEYDVELWSYSRFLNLNVNTNIRGLCKGNFGSTLYINAVQ